MDSVWSDWHPRYSYRPFKKWVKHSPAHGAPVSKVNTQTKRPRKFGAVLF